MPGLRIRKVADKSEGMRVPGFDPFSGEKVLINPDTGRPEPWPFAGVAFEGDIPDEMNVPTSFVIRGRNEGWVTVEGEEVVHRPGGPEEDLWRVTHTFVHLSHITIHTLDGAVRYRVTHQPDKYVEGGSDTDPVTPDIYSAGQTQVDSFYGLKREK